MSATTTPARGVFLPTQHRGLLYVTDDVADAARRHVLADLEAEAVETDLGPAVLLRDVRRTLTGGAS